MTTSIKSTFFSVGVGGQAVEDDGAAVVILAYLPGVVLPRIKAHPGRG